MNSPVNGSSGDFGGKIGFGVCSIRLVCQILKFPRFVPTTSFEPCSGTNTLCQYKYSQISMLTTPKNNIQAICDINIISNLLQEHPQGTTFPEPLLSRRQRGFTGGAPPISKRLEPIVFAHCLDAFLVTRHNYFPLDDELIIQFGIIIERYNSTKFVRDLQGHGLKV